MSSSARCQLIVFLLSISAAVLPPVSGAAESGYVTVPIPLRFAPAMEQDGSPRYVTTGSIEKEIRSHSPKLEKFYSSKKIEKFVVPSGDWLKQLLDMYKAILAENSLRGEADTWDCENFSSLLNALSTISVWRAGYMDTKARPGLASGRCEKNRGPACPE